MTRLPLRPANREQTHPNRRCWLQTEKLESQNHLSPLKLKSQTPDAELQELLFALLGFGLGFLQHFLTVPHFLFLPFEVVTFILCHRMLEGCNTFKGECN